VDCVGGHHSLHLSKYATATTNQYYLHDVTTTVCWFQSPRGLRSRSWLLGCWDRGFESRSEHGCLSLCLYAVFCVGGGLCDELITRPKESYHVSNKIRETSKMRPWRDPGWSAVGETSKVLQEYMLSDFIIMLCTFKLTSRIFSEA
jgi:hypothetical protein